MNTNGSSSPRSFEEAMSLARALLSDADIELLCGKPLHEAIWSLHLTLGHSLREHLSLWADEALPLFQDITEKMPEHPALDADTASSALITALWLEFQNNRGRTLDSAVPDVPADVPPAGRR